MVFISITGRCPVLLIQGFQPYSFSVKFCTIMKHIKIKFYAVSFGWSYGGIMDIRIKAKEGCEISISWGDGKNITHIFRSRFAMVFSHDYFPKHIIPPSDGEKFYVEIRGNTDCRIIGFRLSPIDMSAHDLDVTNCP